jgi:nicotinamidase-related amidase
MVISDCTATDTEREQKYAEEVIFPKIGKVLTSDEFLDAIS